MRHMALPSNRIELIHIAKVVYIPGPTAMMASNIRKDWMLLNISDISTSSMLSI